MTPTLASLSVSVTATEKYSQSSGQTLRFDGRIRPAFVVHSDDGRPTVSLTARYVEDPTFSAEGVPSRTYDRTVELHFDEAFCQSLLNTLAENDLLRISIGKGGA